MSSLPFGYKPSMQGTEGSYVHMHPLTYVCQETIAMFATFNIFAYSSAPKAPKILQSMSKIPIYIIYKHAKYLVSISSIHPYIPDEIAEHPQPLQPGPVTINNQEEYEVEEILDSRFRWGKLWYLVKFLGWSNLDNMWLPYTEVHTPAVVEKFPLQHPDTLCTPPTSTPITSCCPQLS